MNRERDRALRQIWPIGQVGQIDVLKVPHHGSKTGLSKEFLEEIKPKLAVISVGKKNSYGHPAIETMRILRDFRGFGGAGIKILRTDLDGEIEIVSDGEKYWTNLRN